jgi:6-phosphofructokinase 1
MDRALCTAFGAKAVELIATKKFGQMVSFSSSQITSVPLSEATGQLRTVPTAGGFVTSARAMGICLGD